MSLGSSSTDLFLTHLRRIRKTSFRSFRLSKTYTRESSNGPKNTIKYTVVSVPAEKYPSLVKLVTMLKIASGPLVSKKDPMISAKVTFAFKLWKLFFVCATEVNSPFCKTWICIFPGRTWRALLRAVWKLLKYIIHIVKNVRRKLSMAIK